MPILELSIPGTSKYWRGDVSNDGKAFAIDFDNDSDQKYILSVQLGNHIPADIKTSASSSTAATQATSSVAVATAVATAGRKRRRRSSSLQASDASDGEQLCITIRYTPSTERKYNFHIGNLYKYHVRIIREIETAFKNAKQARLELEAAPATTKTDLVAAALEIHLLTKELNHRRGIEELYYNCSRTTKFYLVDACTPTRLVGMPGQPVARLFRGDGILDKTPVNKESQTRLGLPAKPVFKQDDVEWFHQNMNNEPEHVQYRQAGEYMASTLNNNIYGQYLLGMCLLSGYGVTKDTEKALSLIQTAAERGLVAAQMRLGEVYHIGTEVEQDLKQALVWYQNAASQGSVKSQFQVGVMYEFGEGVVRNFEKAAMWYRKAAYQNDSDAQYNLGLLYERGKGANKDFRTAEKWYFRKAAKWYRRAADQNDRDAQYNLGRLYETGRGVDLNMPTAVMWYQRAAEQDDSDAQYNLGLLYETGRVVEKNVDEAKAWFQKAAVQGHRGASYSLSKLRLGE